MLWTDCCRVDRAKSEGVLAKKKPLPATRRSANGTRLVNVGIGSVAAGEVSPAEVAPPLSQRSSFSYNFSSGGATPKGPAPATGLQAPAAAAPAGVPVEDEIMPFRRQKTERIVVNTLERRKSLACMADYLDGARECPTPSDQQPSPRPSDPLIEDQGGEAQAATSARVSSARAKPPTASSPRSKDKGKVGKVNSSGRRNSNARDLVVATESEGGVSRAGGSTPDAKPTSPPATPPSMPPLPPPESAPKPQRMNTKELFADPAQTFICLDWDDTLFPTTYVRDDIGLNWQTPLRNQRLDSREKAEITRNLQRCADNCCSLLRSACNCGKVVLVTLAKSPWVGISCDNFYPQVGRLIQELGIPIVYAQEMVVAGEQFEYDKADMSSCEAMERYWSCVKGKAIAMQLSDFYSQYAGQSWKNIISIGDSDFERLGTQQATKGYMRQTGINRSKTVEVSGHVYKVRTKTFKMLDQPSVEELTVQLAMVLKWLPFMVKLDSSFDVNLNDLEDSASIRRIERTLRGQKVD